MVTGLAVCICSRLTMVGCAGVIQLHRRQCAESAELRRAEDRPAFQEYLGFCNKTHFSLSEACRIIFTVDRFCTHPQLARPSNSSSFGRVEIPPAGGLRFGRKCFSGARLRPWHKRRGRLAKGSGAAAPARVDLSLYDIACTYTYVCTHITSDFALGLARARATRYIPLIGETYGVELSLLSSIILAGSSIPRAIRLQKPVPILLSFLATYGLYTFGDAFRRKY